MRNRIFGPGLVLFAGDIAVLALSLNFAYVIRARVAGLPGRPLEFLISRPGLSLFILAVYLFFFFVFDLYNPRSWPTMRALAGHLFGATLLSAVVFMAHFWIAPYRFGRGLFFMTLAAITAGSFLWRGVVFRSFRRHVLVHKFILLGRSEERDDILPFTHPRSGAAPAGFIPFEPIGGARIEPTLRDTVEKTIAATGAGILVLPLEALALPGADRLILRARRLGAAVRDYASFYEEISDRVPIAHVTEPWLLQTQGFRLLEDPATRRLKRILDVALSLLCLTVTLPLSIFIAAMIKMTSRGPVFFTQERQGEGQSTYNLRKFRTMIVGAEPDGPQWAEENDLRVTAFGRLLRRTRLDELPQFLNVLAGTMSIVGPRPEREFFVRLLEAEIPHYALRFVAKPGITGWAQIHYKYGASVEDSRIKLMYDLFYIKNFSLLLDLKIILRTIRVILFGLGR